MKTILKITALAAVAAFSLPAQAQERASLPEALFGGIVQERDVALAFSFLHQALDGALQGREIQPPEELARRADEIGDEVRQRGAAAAHALLEALERRARNAVRGR